MACSGLLLLCADWESSTRKWWQAACDAQGVSCWMFISSLSSDCPQVSAVGSTFPAWEPEADFPQQFRNQAAISKCLGEFTAAHLSQAQALPTGPSQMHPEEREAGRQQLSQTPENLHRLWPTGCRSSNAVVASSLAQQIFFTIFLFLHTVNSAPASSASLHALFPCFKTFSPFILFQYLSSLLCCPVYFIQNTPERILPITLTSVFCPSFSRMNSSTWRPSTRTCCPVTALEGSHLFLPMILTGNQQPFLLQADTCKGKRCEGKEQTSPGVMGHMALPHVTERLCKRTSSQGDCFVLLSVSSPLGGRKGLFLVNHRHTWAGFQSCSSPFPLFICSTQIAQNNGQAWLCTHSSSCPAGPGPAAHVPGRERAWLYRHVLQSDSKSFHRLAAVIEKKYTGTFSCLLQKSSLSRTSKSSMHVGTPIKSCMWLNLQ